MSVTPFVGVWIETAACFCFSSIYKSHPSWVCGLKRFIPLYYCPARWSHPSWVCGLKHLFAVLGTVLDVTPFVGVWIETGIKSDVLCIPSVTPFVGVWIETTCRYLARSRLQVTPFVGVWIETYP